MSPGDAWKLRDRILANNMLVLPGCSFEHDLETLRLNQQCRPDFALAMLWQPYPGTALGNHAREKGYYQGNWDDLDFTYYSRSHVIFASALEKRRMDEAVQVSGRGASGWSTCRPGLLSSLRRRDQAEAGHEADGEGQGTRQAGAPEEGRGPACSEARPGITVAAMSRSAWERQV